ncbi:MAG TPA: hypothetical protein DCR14_09035, partial [Acidimicrobiaceae bacterium]|nr:hypothetical protein [Acidimicrobiaceae bacterium]
MTDPNNSVKAGAIEQIYTQLMKVLGGNNPNQFFCMTMPGTMLNQSDFAYDTTGNKPATVTAAESRLVDQMFDIAQVTGSSNGERVSSQYLQALSALVPTFAPMMPAMKNSLREFLASPAPPDAVVEGVPYSGTIEGFYFALYEAWLDKKAEWDRLVIEQRRKLNPEDFLEWYEGVAEGYLARIDAAEGRLLAAFSPTDMDAILGALAAGPGGELQEAIDQVLDLRLPSPSGGYIYPVDLQPSNWFLDLSSDQDPANLLKDPQFIAATIGARRQAILASISQVQSMLSQMPTTGAIAAAAKTYSDAQSAYTTAQNQLLDAYTTNTVTAVELLMAAASGGESEAAVEGVEGVEELDATVESVSKASGDSPVQTSAANSDGSPLSPDDLKKLVDGQTAVIKAQSALVDGASALSAAGMNLAAQQAAYFGDLPSLLARLQSQLSDLQSLQSQMAASIQASKRQVASSSSISATAATVTAAAALANVAKTDPSTTPADWLVALYGAIKTTELQPVYLDAQAAWVGEVADAIATAASGLSSGASAIGEAADAAAKAGGD